MTDAVLSKIRSILTLHDPEGYEKSYGDRCYLATCDDGAITRQVYLDIATYQDLGEPETITITIEPGDTLN